MIPQIVFNLIGLQLESRVGPDLVFHFGCDLFFDEIVGAEYPAGWQPALAGFSFKYGVQQHFKT